MAGLVDAYGRPMRRAELQQEISGPTLTGVRSPSTGYPGDGLDPRRLATVLREADEGNPVRYLELAETMEERDAHYVGVLGTRRRSVSQLEITVEEGGDSPAEEAAAQMVRDWLRRDELADELFDILDAIGKGYSFTEIIWETSAGQWRPQRLEWRDPRWFRFDRLDLRTPLLIDEAGRDQPLPGGKFISAVMRAKSGITPRGGLARVATWCYLFKKYTERDWSIFTQTYGQPLRLGRFPPHASEADRDTLFRAVANIAGDCAAIIPEGMSIDFVTAEAKTSVDLYQQRAEWYDKQVSKAVLGQTSTTDAEVGGLGSGKEHREVQQDIETADARALTAILNRDLIRPWVTLNFGPQARYPRLRIARPEAEDLKQMADALAPFIDRGLAVPVSWVRGKFGAPEPAEGEETLRAGGPQTPEPDRNGPVSQIKPPFNTRLAPERPVTPLDAQGRSTGRTEPLSAAVDVLAAEAGPAMGRMLAQIEAMLAAAGSLDEFRTMLMEAYPELPTDELAEILGRALVAAELGGRAMVEEEGQA